MEPAYPFWLMLHAWALVHSDVEPPDNLHHVPAFHEAVTSICEEKRWIRRGSFLNTGLYYARQMRENADDSPEEWFLDFAPGEAVCEQYLDFARGHLNFLQLKQANDWPLSQWRWDPWIEEAEDLINGYHALAYAHQVRRVHPEEPWICRHHLKKAQDVFGKEAIKKGIYPPPVPLHRFTEIKP